MARFAQSALVWSGATKVKKHPTIPGLFLTEDGRAFRELAASPASGGYHTIKIGRRTYRRHVLMAETFNGPRPAGATGVRHDNGNPGDDRPSNLLWGTQADNAQDTVRHGRSTRGETSAQARLAAGQVREIRLRRSEGESGASLAAEFGVSVGTVCDIVKRRTWRHV